MMSTSAKEYDTRNDTLPASAETAAGASGIFETAVLDALRTFGGVMIGSAGCESPAPIEDLPVVGSETGYSELIAATVRDGRNDATDSSVTPVSGHDSTLG